ncbi:MAG: formylglycine-generating enzyme family protein [Deltaproteobacteria bacterium]|nr:formylglycine-generating enzyme family protein [Deltaproteobacteria bacterium]
MPCFSLTAVFPAPSPGEKKVRNSLGMEFVYIRPGNFMMGSPSNESGRDDDETQHRVTLTRGYYLQTTEVTQGQWERVMGTRPWSGKKYVEENANHPAVYVSWNDCREFIRKLNQKEGTNKYRLPTEAEPGRLL